MAENEQKEQNEQNEGNSASNGKMPSRLSGLLSKDVLVPAAATALTAAAAGLAAKKGPDLKSKIMGEAREGAEELGREGAEGAKEAIGGGRMGALASGASKLIPGKGGGGSKKKTRRLPIQRWTDVAVPVERAYEQWTKFEEFPKFMHRVLDVKQTEADTPDWQGKIRF